VIKVTYNAPGKEFIGYDVDNVADQVRISDAEVDARDEQEQRTDFERTQDEAELAYDRDDTPAAHSSGRSSARASRRGVRR
jgi:hypothetical protein